ncbi:valyl-tRNA synthetase, partial [Mycoplasmopsis synoviae]
MERFEAREKMAQFLEENNYLIKAEDSISNVSYSDRSNSVIETLMLPQW